MGTVPRMSDSYAGTVALDGLSDAPWARPLDPVHLESLAEVATLPAIVITAAGVIVDGHHRVAVARARGATQLPCRVVSGNPAELLEMAARSNCTHGLPWPRAARTSAARQLLELEPGWSDRRIGGSCGLSHQTIGRLRAQLTLPQCSTGPSDRMAARSATRMPVIERRVGADGRSRPADPAAQRQRVSELVRASPPMTDHEIRRATGASLTTVRQVRREAEAAHRLAAPIPRWVMAIRAAEAAMTRAGRRVAEALLGWRRSRRRQ